jgi:hypothetical protein
MASRPSHWETRTRCGQVEGAPLEKNVVERAVQRCIRPRHHALFSTQEHRGSRARVLTSLMATCLSAGVNGLDALVALHEPRAEVCADPAA